MSFNIFEVLPYLCYQAINICILIGFIIGCHKIYVWSGITKHNTKHNVNISKRKSNVDKGIIYLIDESIDRKSGLFELIMPKNNNAFDTPQKICNMIKEINVKTPIKVVINTVGGDLFACDKILDKLIKHPYGYIAYILNEAMSAGTIIALGAKEIVMNDDSYLGKIDPQVRTELGMVSAINFCDFTIHRSCLDSITYNTYKSSIQALNYVTDILKKIINNQNLYESICEKMIYLDQPHFKKFNVSECQKIGLPVRQPTEDELIYFD